MNPRLRFSIFYCYDIDFCPVNSSSLISTTSYENRFQRMEGDQRFLTLTFFKEG